MPLLLSRSAKEVTQIPDQCQTYGSCVTGCMDGMEVNSKSSDRVKEARESVTEFY
jgi:NADH dehydrogenase/NADH:ubiquinone oxidoreductase subunit G